MDPMRFITEPMLDGAFSPILNGLDRVLRSRGHERIKEAAHEDLDLVIHPVINDRPKPFRRRGRGTFVVSVAIRPHEEATVEGLYPLLVRTLANLLIVVTREADPIEVHLVTPEQGHVVVKGNTYDDAFFDALYKRIEPLATSSLVIENIFEPDLEPELWNGDAHTASIGRAGRFLDELQLLPAPFPIEQILSPRELRQLKLVYGIGGLSYGNFSSRLDNRRFWMSASGVDKSRLEVIGRDILLVTDYVPERKAMRLSVPPNVEPRRVSVDAIEHWLIYRENPQVGAILHVHAWLDGAPCTEMTYPCGTYELGRAVADIVRVAPDPVHAVVGLKNHGLTITGTSLDEILSRVTGSLVRNVPMT
ncbi:MAG TPA: class II aldolase/adducin family protein [Longimicrobiales bacterium]